MIYVSTDSNEVRAILENSDVVSESRSCVRDYFQTFDRILFEYCPIIMNLPIKLGEEIQKKDRLDFNPMSVIDDTVMSFKGNKKLISKLRRENLYVTKIETSKVRQEVLTE